MARPRTVTAATARTQAEKEAIERAWLRLAAYESFADYAWHMWDVAEPGEKCIWGRHMDVICNEVQAVMAEADRRRALYLTLAERHAGDPDALAAAVNVELGSLPRLRLCVLVPPRQSKSTLLGRLFPAWRWLHRPQDQILILTAVDDLIERDGLRVRDTLRHDEYLAMQEQLVRSGKLPPADRRDKLPTGTSFGLRGDQYAKEKFQTTAGGARHGYPIGGRFVGVNADVIVIDDPHDIADAMNGSPASQLRCMMEVRNDYKDKIQDRLSSQIWGVVILIMQRVHPKDLADYMIEQGARVVCLPGRYDPEHPHVYAKDWRTVPREPLNPNRLPESIMAAMEAESPHGFATKVMMRPSVQEGVKFRRDWFRQRYGTIETWREEAHRIAARLEEVVISVDAAATANARSDYTAIHVWGRQGQKRVLLDRYYKQVEYAELLRAFDAMVAEWPEATVKLIENKSNGITLITDRQDTVPGIVKVNPHVDKLARANHIPFEGGVNLWIPNAPWAEEYVENMVGFGAGGMHDDDVDATSQVMERWALGVRPWFTRDRRDLVAAIAPGVVVPGIGVRWGRPEPGVTYTVGVVPGWANGQSPAVAVVLSGRGRMCALIEVHSGGVDAFTSALAIEAEFWQRVVGGRYAETDGRPVEETVRSLARSRVRVSGLLGKFIGEKGAGWRGTKPETAALWGAFLQAVNEGRMQVTDGRTMSQLETVVEVGGIPAMGGDAPLSGRVLALLLANAAVQVPTAEDPGLPRGVSFAPERKGGLDLWAVGGAGKGGVW